MSKAHSTPKSFYVYTLCRPNGKTFYVGKGQRTRVFDHEGEARRGCDCRKCRTIRKIWRQGQQIQRYIVFTTDNETEAFEYEVELIASYGLHNLTNHTEGGDGARGLSDEFRAKRSAENRKRWKRPAYRAFHERVSRERWDDPSYRSRVSAGIRARWADPEHRARMLEKRSTPGFHDKMSARIKAMWADPEYRARVAATRNTPEYRERARAAAKKCATDPEVRAKKSVAMKARLSDPEEMEKLRERTKRGWETRRVNKERQK